jgi:SecD/SecF fusion protein
MQLKGLVKFFTALFILGFLYQLSFTFSVRNVEKATRAKAEKQVRMMHPNAGDSLQTLVDDRYAALIDSIQGKKTVNMLFSKYTYAEAKDQTLNLGLDLQGGMNVTLDVSLDELLRQLSNNPTNPELNKALAEASKEKANSSRNFVDLFVAAFQRANPGQRLAYLFAKPSEEKITLKSTDNEVATRLKQQADDAISSTYNILQKRIDKFGVSQPNVNLDKQRGIITVELAGVTNPERVRGALQSTAKLQFFEAYTNQEIYKDIQAANDALAVSLGGVVTTDSAAKKSTDSTTAKKTDSTTTGSLANYTNPTATTTKDGKTDSTSLKQAEAERKYPLLSRLYIPEDLAQRPGPIVGLVAKKDTALVMKYLNSDAVRAKFPADVKFLYGAELGTTKFDANAPVYLYAMKAIPGTLGSRLEGEHIANAKSDFNQINGQAEVLMTMDQAGSALWAKMTRDAAGKYVAVVLDDKVYSAPFNSEEISGGSTSISGSFTAQTAEDLANILKIGKLPAPAHIVQEQVVGPTLGKENIDAGFKSLAIAFVVIFLLMLIYYNTGGIVANIALVLNVLFTFGILAVFHATLTMAGIAGLVLTIGMAVDTNVIVFERIKEELSLGKGYAQAITDGYKRSYAPVLDGHITQFLTAVILFSSGLGPVRGFAYTQMWGLLFSVYCGLLVSRLITEMYMKRERHFKYFTGLSKSIFRKAHFKFIEMRKYTYMISGVVLLAGIGAFINGFDYGVEFSGGRSYDIRFAEKHTATEIHEKLAKYFGGERPVVKTIGNANTFNITTSYLIKDPAKNASDKVREALYTGLKGEKLIPANVTPEQFRTQYLSGTGQERTVLPLISEDLKKRAIIGTMLSLLAIFVYILIRFRKWQYSLGTIVSLLHDVCVTLAVFSFFRGRVPFALEIDQHFIAAILTVIGFSMNDTVIVFDRVREYFRKHPGEGKKSVINRAINDTLSRTIMTSLTVFLTVLILFIFGGEVTRGFAFAMLIGVVTGTYSSIFVAAPILVDMDKSDSLKNEVDTEMRIEELRKLA